MANMFDRTATAEDDDLDARARSLASGPAKRDRPSSEGKPSALDRARGRGYAPPDDSMDRAKRGLGTEDNSTAAQPPSQAITPVPPRPPMDGVRYRSVLTRAVLSTAVDDSRRRHALDREFARSSRCGR